MAGLVLPYPLRRVEERMVLTEEGEEVHPGAVVGAAAGTEADLEEELEERRVLVAVRRKVLSWEEGDRTGHDREVVEHHRASKATSSLVEEAAVRQREVDNQREVDESPFQPEEGEEHSHGLRYQVEEAAYQHCEVEEVHQDRPDDRPCTAREQDCRIQGSMERWGTEL